mmetsp:Transcript_110580/g.321784  ORF Transcript_110580/g.321784 Transcript_110580/m.321784 type:complete len:159 (+) Transcript_110580:125-601(+)
MRARATLSLLWFWGLVLVAGRGPIDGDQKASCMVVAPAGASQAGTTLVFNVSFAEPTTTGRRLWWEISQQQSSSSSSTSTSVRLLRAEADGTLTIVREADEGTGLEHTPSLREGAEVSALRRGSYLFLDIADGVGVSVTAWGTWIVHPFGTNDRLRQR